MSEKKCYWMPYLSESQYLNENEFNINEATLGPNYIFYKNQPLIMKFQTNVHIDTKKEYSYFIKPNQTLQLIQDKFAIKTNDIGLILSHSTSLTNKDGNTYTELGLDINGNPDTTYLGDKLFKCILTVYLSVNEKSYLYCNPIDIQFI